MRFYYLANMIDSVTVSERHNSDYSQKCLDYIPGSAVSGALASVLYRQSNVDKKALNTVFQSNSSVFSNCLPLRKNIDTGAYELVFPAVSCLYYEKGTEEGEKPYINRTVAYSTGKQLKQVRSGYMSSDGSKYSVKKDSVTKTAIDYRTLTAADSQLFSLSFISKGELFWGWADIPDGIPFTDDIKNFFNSEIRIGKSRTSEFGRVKLQLLSSSDSERIKNWQECKVNKKDRLYLWCLSDIEFVDLTSGMPTVIPQSSNFWLGGNVAGDWIYDAESSFVRTGNVRFFNRKRNGLDGEKQFIRKGSLICFRKRKEGQELSDKELNKISLNGIGLSRHQGFGTVMVNPSWIDSRKEIRVGEENSLYEQLFLQDLKAETDDCECEDYDYLTSFVSFLAARDDNDYELHAYNVRKKIFELYRLARVFNDKLEIDQYGRKSDNVVNWGPNNSQWSILLDIIKLEKGADDKILSDASNTAVMKAIEDKLLQEKDRESSKTTWNVHFATEDKAYTTMREEFIEIIRNQKLGSVKRLFDTLIHYNLSVFNNDNVNEEERAD